MSTQYIFTMYKLSRVHPPDKRVLEDISLSFLPGAKIGVLGANGAGKSTLLRIMAGQDTDFRGEAQLAPGATVGLLEQEPQLDPAKDVPGDADVTTLSGGERRRVALCRLLLTAPDLLLLDEPTNHLDAESVAWLEKHLEEYKGTVVAVTHDRYFLDNLAGWILQLDPRRRIPFKGHYTALLAEERDVKLDRVQIHIPAGPRLGNVVVETDSLRKGYGDRLLIEDLTFS